jgi:hypothetical protein
MSTLISKKNLLLLLTTTTASGVLSQDSILDLCAKAYPDGTCQTCTVQNDVPQCDVAVYGFTQPVTFNSNGPVVDYNAAPVSCASVYGIGCGDCNRQNCVLKCCNTVDNTAFIDPGSGFSVPCSTPTLPSVPNGFNSGCLSCNSNTCLECAMGWLLKGNVCERCSSHFGSGCSQCTQDVCTVTDTGNYIKNGTSYSCKSDFGTECATCDSVRGCTSLSVNDGTFFLKKNVNNTLLVASPCNPDMGQNCQTCNSTACTSLRSPVGTICNFVGKNNQGIYCMQLGSTCQQCSCSTTNVPVCTLKSTTSTYFVNKDGFVEKCQDQVLFGGQYCLTCNRTGCTQAMSNSALNLTNSFQAIPCSSSFYGVGCATCNSTSCKTALTGFSIDPINSTRSASCPTMWGEGCITCGLSGCTASASGYAVVDVVSNRRDFSRKGTRSSKCTDTHLGSGTLNCRSFKQTSSGTHIVYNHETTSVTPGYCMPIDPQTGLRVTRKCSEDNTVLTCRSNDCFPIKVVDGKCVNSKGKVINKNVIFNANTVPPELVNSLTLCRVRSEVGCVFRITNNPGFSIDVIDRLQLTFNWDSNANLYAGVSVLDIDPMTAMEKVVASGRPQMFTVAKKVNNNNPQCLILPLQMEIRVMSSNTLVYPAEELCPVYNDCETIVNNDRRRNVDVVPFITKNRRGGDKSLDIKDCIYGRKVYDLTRTVTYSDGTRGPYITGCDCSVNPTFELKNKECVCKDKKLEIRFVRIANSYQCMDPDVYTEDEVCDPIAIWNPSTEECECPVGFEGSGRIDDKKNSGCVKIEDLVGGCVKHGVTNTDDAVCKELNWIVTKSYSTNGKPPVSFAFSWNGGVNQPADTPTPRCYTRQEDLKTGNNKVDWKKPQACFCHRTCSESKPYVRVEADIWSSHCEAVGRGGDFCCGAPGEFYTDMTDGKIYDRSTCKQTGSTGGWSECTENDWVYTGTCGTVTRTCVRTCTNPIPTGGGQCEGSSTIVETVVLQDCAVIVTPITVVVQPLGQCCGSDSGCHKGPCGDPHICTPNPNSGSTTCFDTYARGGTFRIMDLVVYDRFQQLHERLIIDSVFTTSGQTMMRDVTINVNGKTATYVFGESGIVVEGQNISIVDGFVAVSDHTDNTELFHVWFNNATQTFKISPCRYPFLSLFYTIPNREMHMNMYVPGDGNQFTWVASGGLLGLNLPTKKNTVLSVTEKTAMRLDDLISRTFWDNWVTECQSTVGQMCNTYNLTKITNPLVFLSGSPVGPPDSSFMGWVDVSNYGIETVFPAVSSKSLKDMGAQRCFINQWVHEWAIAPPVNDSSSIFATEHFTQCALMKNSVIDNYYQSRWPVAYNNVKKTLGLVSRRRRDTSNPAEVMVQIAVNKLSEHCKFDTNMQGVCGAALLPNGVTVGQAETVRAEFDAETGQVVGSSMNVYYSTIGETDLFLLEADTLNVLQQGTCREGEVPSITKKNTYLSVTAGFEVVEVSKLEMDILNTFFGERIKNINTDFNNRRRNARNTEQQAEIDHEHFLALEYTKNSWDDIMVDSNGVNHCVSEPESCFPGI